MTVQKILALAASQIGVKESPAGSKNVIYNREYYGGSVNNPSLQWCAVFIWWLFLHSGAPEMYFGGAKTASCGTLWGYHKGKAVTDYRPGDVIFYNFAGGSRPMHVGICESCDGTHVTTIEGNTSSTSQDNGGAVKRCKRAKRLIVGAYRPDYKEAETVTYEEFKAFAARLEQERTQGDVPDWAKEEYEKAIAQGITDGTNPLQPIPRYQAVIMALRARK